METPSVSVPIPVSNNFPANNLNTNEMKCSYSAFDPSSPPQKSLFLQKLLYKT